MNQPKYEIGDRISQKKLLASHFVRGVMVTSTGFRYFVQVDESDCSYVIDEADIDEEIEV